jgi:hypothetical protein
MTLAEYETLSSVMGSFPVPTELFFAQPTASVADAAAISPRARRRPNICVN